MSPKQQLSSFWFQEPLDHTCKKARFMNLLERNIDCLRSLTDKTHGKKKSMASKLSNLVMILDRNTCSCMRRRYESAKKELRSKLTVTVSKSKTHFPKTSTPSSVPETRASQKVQRKRTLNVSDPSSNKIVASNKNIKVVSSKSIKNSVASGRQNVIPSSRPYIRGVSGELCPEKGCNCRLFTVFEYYSHIAEKHGLKKLKCPLTHCDVYFAEFNVEQMRKHASEWHSELTESERKCGQCEYVALSIPLKVYHHFEFHMPNGQWWCRTGCGFASKVRNDWISHEKSEKCPRFRYKE